MNFLYLSFLILFNRESSYTFLYREYPNILFEDNRIKMARNPGKKQKENLPSGRSSRSYLCHAVRIE